MYYEEKTNDSQKNTKIYINIILRKCCLVNLVDMTKAEKFAAV